MLIALIAQLVIQPTPLQIEHAGRWTSQQGTYLGAGTGAVVQTIETKLRQIVNIKDYGAVCDGATDAAPAIRNAITAAGVGGTVIIPGCSSTYLLNSYDSTGFQGDAIMFYPLEGQTISADYGAQLKVANSALNTGLQVNGGVVFLINNVNHVTLQGIRIDMNGANNQTPVGGFHPAYAFLQNGGSYNSIQNNEILNSPGVNAILVGYCALLGTCADQCKVDGNVIRNGGTTLSGGNPNQIDWSGIYVECTHASITANRMISDNYPSASLPNNGGIEIHGSYSVAERNYIDKAYPAFYVGSLTSSDITDVVVSNNIITNSFYGVSFFPKTLTDNYGRMNVFGNTILLKQFSGMSSQPVGIFMQRNASAIFATGPGLLYDSELSGNVISSSGAGTDNSIGVTLDQTKNLRVHDNLLSQLGNMCVNLVGAPLGHTDAVIDANICKDFWLTSPAGTKMGFDIDSLGDRPPLRTSPTVVALHQWVRPTTNNGFTYDATTAGTTSGAEPTWPLVLGNTVTDGTVVWTARAAWPYNGIVMRNNIFSQTTNQAAQAGIYMTNDVTANPPMTFANITVGPNLTHGIGNIVLGVPAPGYNDVTNNVLYNRSNLAAASTSDDQFFDSIATRTGGNAFAVRNAGANQFRVANDNNIYLDNTGSLRYTPSASFLISGSVASGSAANGAFQFNSWLTLSGASDKLVSILNNGTPKASVDKDGRLNFTGVTFANLGTGNTTNGTMVYCSDCTVANPCAGAGTGALAKRLNGAWVCN